MAGKTYSIDVTKMQDLFDLCLQECGSLEGLFAFMQTGNIQDLNVAPPALVICNTDNVFDNNVVKNFKTKRTKIATGGGVQPTIYVIGDHLGRAIMNNDIILKA